ncbi:hypothetical protein KCU83_g623, partial [Aureobasidium melanogenum]
MEAKPVSTPLKPLADRRRAPGHFGSLLLEHTSCLVSTFPTVQTSIDSTLIPRLVVCHLDQNLLTSRAVGGTFQLQHIATSGQCLPTKSLG